MNMNTISGNNFEQDLSSAVLAGIRDVVLDYKDELEFGDMEAAIRKVLRAYGNYSEVAIEWVYDVYKMRKRG